MKIEHIALWVRDLEKMKQFYTHYFDTEAGEKYINHTTKFESYFLTFSSGARLEIMHMPELSTLNSQNQTAEKPFAGYAHLAFSTGSKENVDTLTQQLKNDNHTVVREPRTTGDGYYESVVLDPEDNIIEITV